MNVQRKIRKISMQRTRQVGTERHIGDEMSVHDVHMQQITAGFKNTLNFFSQPHLIGGQNGWCNLNHNDPSMFAGPD